MAAFSIRDAISRVCAVLRAAVLQKRIRLVLGAGLYLKYMARNSIVTLMYVGGEL